MAPSVKSRRKPQVPAEDTAAFGPIAERFRRAGDLERAVSLCREGLQKFPDHISARVTLGWSLLDLGKYNESRTELEAVLRRAPDNLSAIRGLAELHDRSEHTMDLPMDGPGQWPPDASTLDEMDEPVATIATESGAGDDIVDESVWVPVRGANENDVLIAPPELGLAMWSAVPAVEPEIGPLVSNPSGFGSVREIDPQGAAVSLAAVEEMARANADIEALIAEAESLEAAADVASIEAVESMEPTLVLESGLDLANLDDVALSMPVELTSGVETQAEFTAGVDGPTDLTAGSDIAVELTAGSDIAVELTAGADARTEPIVAVNEAVDEPVYVAAAETITELTAESLATVELTASVEPPPSIDAPVELTAGIDEPAPVMFVAEAEPEVVIALAEEIPTAETWQLTAEEFDPAVEESGAAVALDTELDALISAVDESGPEAMELPFAAAVAQELAHVAEVITLPRVFEPNPVRSPIPGLERFLARVQARRRILVTESVA